jgi:hypothetical protein
MPVDEFESALAAHRARTAEIRRNLDAAVDAAIPVAGGDVLKALERLRCALDAVDERNAREGTLPVSTRGGSLLIPDHWTR